MLIQRIFQAALLLISTLPMLAIAGEDRVAHAQSAAPASISADATVIVDGEVVKEGSNGWTCMPDTMPEDNATMCNAAERMGFRHYKTYRLYERAIDAGAGAS